MLNNRLPSKYYLHSFGIWLMAILLGMLLIQTFPTTSKLWAKENVRIATLANGKYQFCTQPEPKDWQQGAGVCLIFTKKNHHIDGYYGYPHSDSFICIKGQIKGNIVTGKALAILFPLAELSSPPKSEFTWDVEQRLVISQGKIVRTYKDEWGRIDWMLFQKSTLNVDGLYQYNRPKMTSPSQLCDWNFRQN